MESCIESALLSYFDIDCAVFIRRRHSMMEPFVREPLPDFPPLPPRHPPGPVHPPAGPPVPPLPAVDCRILVLNAQLRFVELRTLQHS